MFKSEKINELLPYSVGFVFLLLVLRLFFGYYPQDSYNVYDDWFRYLDNASSISNGNLLISKGAYYGPGSWLYNYFLAVFFPFFGRNMTPYFLIQCAVLIISAIYFLKVIQRNYTSRNFIYSVGFLNLWLLIDFFPNYSVRLLSEPLTCSFILLWLSFLLPNLKNIENPKNSYPEVILFGIIVLTRMSWSLFLPFYLFNLWQRFKCTKVFFINALLLTTIPSTLGFFNLLQTGEIHLLPTEGASDSFQLIQNSNGIYFIKKALFQIGYLPTLVPEFKIRIHWILLFSLGTYITIKLLKIKSFFRNENSMLMLFWLYFLTNLIFVKVESYGYRNEIPLYLILGTYIILSIKDKVKTQ